MATRTLLRHSGAGLWLLATLAVGSAAAQNLYVGPGTVVIHRYRPGGRLYSPNTYVYVQPNPFVYYGPPMGTIVPIPPAPRVQRRSPVNFGIGPAAPSPYREYYTPHIPRYRWRQDDPEQDETPQDRAAEPQPAAPTDVSTAPETEDERVSPRTDDRTSRPETQTSEPSRAPARRRPVRFR